MRRVRGQNGDEGATLIFVLVFLLSFSLIVPALLTTAQTNVSSVTSTRQVGATTSDASAAAEVATNAIRRSVYDNVPSQPCFHDPLDLLSGAADSSAMLVTGSNTAAGALVTCRADPATGYPTTVRQTVTSPQAALLTTSTAPGEDGLKQTSNNVLRVAGKIYSASTINVTNNNSSVIDSSPVKARGTCSGAVLGTPTTCNDTSSDPLYTAPLYALPGTSPSPASVPNCTGGTKAYTLSPGTYTSASRLSNLTKNCAGSLVYFSPGTYYFDFTDSTPVWSITGGYVVGGTPSSKTAAWSVAGFPGTAPPVPGSCIAPGERTDASGNPVPDNGGVMFIFGGASQMAISAGAQVELCGAYSATRPSIAVFGANTGSGGSGATVTVKTDGTGSKTGGDAVFSPYSAIQDLGGATADAVLSDKSKVTTGTVTVPLPATVPAGSTLVGATLRVAHRDLTGPAVGAVLAGPVTSLNITIKPTSSGASVGPDAGSSLSLVPVASTATPVHEDSLDVSNALRTSFNSGFTGVSATFQATSGINTSATEQLDSIQLDLDYLLPGFKKQNGCATQTPYTGTGSGPCAMISTTGNASRLYIAGTTYAPLAALDVSLNHITRQVFQFGLVARVLVVNITGSADYTSPVISVPETTGAYAATVDLTVFLQVYLCEATTTCPPPPVPALPGYVPAVGSGWVRRLTTQVAYKDAAYPPVAGSRQVTVRSWSHVR